MTRHEFVFSGKRRHRIARHVAFWAVWCVVYLLLFHYPIHAFKGWGFSVTEAPEAFRNVQKIGIATYVIKTLVFNSFLSIVIPQAIFTSVILYYVLPNFFYKKRHPLVIACVIIAVLLIYFIIAIHFKYLNDVGDYLFLQKAFMPYSFFLERVPYSVVREQVTSLPIVAGFALMIKLVKRWWLKQKETEQLASEKTKALLQLLKAQVHPHFLFNTLNNIYYFTLSGSSAAPEMIKKLSDLLHYILHECTQPMVPLQKEIKMIRDYMALEKIRFGEQMEMSIEVQNEASDYLIAPLLLIPFVENSFKHGASRMLAHSWIKLRIRIDNSRMHFHISNSRPAEPEQPLQKGNIGLNNVTQRLRLLYPGSHELNIVSLPECYMVSLSIQLQATLSANTIRKGSDSTIVYAMA